MGAVPKLDRRLLTRRTLPGSLGIPTCLGFLLDLAQIGPIYNVDAVQIARDVFPPLLEAFVRHADGVAGSELLGPSLGELPLLLINN